ncbi:FGGY-family carbohydrate kinase [Cellulomonas aerilata]|uniref:Sugar kinase n=1 Tax=Cellulomonas aerilata TaxID=515326 RepID=A0A512DG19_9CELL|nr:FGGY family carbohydrate kinase [Cellulomonas aerilata]GEO35427.1 sugar kinase [Cellulomonas aerilata]
MRDGTGRAGPGTGAVPGPVPVLGLDVGSTNVKAVLVSADAGAGTLTEVAVRAAPTPADPDFLVRVVVDLVRAVLDGHAPPHAVGIASMAETGAAFGADRSALTPLLRWESRRGTRDADALTGDLGRDALFAATGVRPSAKVPLVTWAWLRRTRPDVWRRTAWWAGAADLVCWAMTGRLVTDHTLAGRTMAYRLPASGESPPDGFDPDLLAAVGLRPEQLPVVARPGEAAGVVVHPDLVAAGLAAGTPVVVAGHDHPVGSWAAGMRAPGDRADSVGTAEAVTTVLGGPVDRAAVAAQGMSLVRTVTGAHEAVVSGSPAAGGMVRWWLETVLPGRTVSDALAAALPGGDALPAAPTGLLVLPYPSGRQSPVPDPAARVRVLDDGDRDVTGRVLAPVPGTGVPAGAARSTVAMLEGLALQARWMLDVQQRLARAGTGDPGGDPRGGPVRPLLVLGGAGATSTVWMHLKAAVTAADVHLVTAAEPVATGAALLAAERLGLVPAGALRLPVQVLPRPVDAGPYDAVAERFVRAATGPAATGPARPDGTR